ncbi:MAG: hypothetical protein KKE39_14760, partial [Bacteroidetes bacterium]|nr:hypothetical protein [Bacteroidota bacterium]
IINGYLNQKSWIFLKDKYSHYTNSGYLTIFFGDSMTENLQTCLNNSDSILNMGIGGDFSEGLIERASDVTRLSPDNLFIMIGVNDVLADLPVTQIQKNYEMLIDIIKTQSPKTTIFIQSTLPVRSMTGKSRFMRRCNTNIASLNNFLYKLTEEKRITYIDMYSTFLNTDNDLKIELTTDGIHLNQKGYSIWKNYLNQYLKMPK